MKRIAIIDDDLDFCEALRNALAGSGECVVEYETDACAAERFLSEFGPDIVFLDLRMPGLSGEEVYLSLHGRERFNGVRWIMLSGLEANEGVMPGDPPMRLVPKNAGTGRFWEIIREDPLAASLQCGAVQRRMRILMVDDEGDFCDVIRSGLEATGRYQVSCLTDPFKVEEKLAGEHVDAILLDLRMPGRSGEEIILSLKGDARWQHLPVILITALWDRDGTLSRFGDVAVLSKPVTFERLDGELLKLLAAGN